MIEIDKGIHLPDPKPGPDGKWNRRSKPCKYPWLQMEVGDSFFVKNGNIATMASMAHQQKRYGVGVFTCRERSEGDIVGVRVWRVE